MRASMMRQNLLQFPPFHHIVVTASKHADAMEVDAIEAATHLDGIGIHEIPS